MSDGWSVDPATGECQLAEPWMLPADPNQYKYELQCHLGGGDFDTPCLARQLDCKNGPDGKDGIPVVWLKAPKGIPNPVWTFHSGPTCLFDPNPKTCFPASQPHPERVPEAAVAPELSLPNRVRTHFGARRRISTQNQQNSSSTSRSWPRRCTWWRPQSSTRGTTATGLRRAATVMGGPLPQDRWGEKTRTSHVYTPDRRLPSGAHHPFPGNVFRQQRTAAAHPRPGPVQCAAADHQCVALRHPELRRRLHQESARRGLPGRGAAGSVGCQPVQDLPPSYACSSRSTRSIRARTN